MLRYRLSDAAQVDVINILAWTHEQFGEAARLRYESLIVAALRDVATQPDRPGSIARPELGAGVRSWHLQLSRDHVAAGAEVVRRPRHFLVYRFEPALLVVGRVLHDAMELARHLEPDTSWDWLPAHSGRPFDRSKLGGVAAARQASRELPVASDS